MHWPVGETGRWLRRVVQGWLNYHAIPGNSQRIQPFRGRGDSSLASSASPPQPTGRIVGPGNGCIVLRDSICPVLASSIRIPISDFALDSRQEPYEVILHVRICAGGRRQRRSLPRYISHGEMGNVANVLSIAFLIKTLAVTTVCHLLEDQNNLSILVLSQSPSLATGKAPLPVSFPYSQRQYAIPIAVAFLFRRAQIECSEGRGNHQVRCNLSVIYDESPTHQFATSPRNV